MVKIWDCTVDACQTIILPTSLQVFSLKSLYYAYNERKLFLFFKKKRPSHWRLMALNKKFTEIHVISCVLASWNNLIVLATWIHGLLLLQADACFELVKLRPHLAGLFRTPSPRYSTKGAAAGGGTMVASLVSTFLRIEKNGSWNDGSTVGCRSWSHQKSCQ